MSSPPRIKKEVKLTVSRKFSDGGLASISFGTWLEMDLPEETSLEDFEKEVAQQCYDGLLEDISEVSSKNKLVRSIFKSNKKQLKREAKINKALKESK